MACLARPAGLQAGRPAGNFSPVVEASWDRWLRVKVAMVAIRTGRGDREALSAATPARRGSPSITPHRVASVQFNAQRVDFVHIRWRHERGGRARSAASGYRFSIESRKTRSKRSVQLLGERSSPCLRRASPSSARLKCRRDDRPQSHTAPQSWGRACATLRSGMISSSLKAMPRPSMA